MLLTMKGKRNLSLILIVSLTVNLVLCCVLLLYLFTPLFDWIVVKKSMYRICQLEGVRAQKVGSDFCQYIIPRLDSGNRD